MIDFKDGPPYRSSFVGKQGEGEAEKLRDFIVAANDGTSPGAMWTIFDDDMVFYVPPELPYGGTFRGIEEVKRGHGKTRDYYDRIHTQIEHIVCVGDMALLYFQFNFRSRKNGRTGSYPMIEIFRLKNGKVIEWRGFHFTPSSVAEILTADT